MKSLPEKAPGYRAVCDLAQLSSGARYLACCLKLPLVTFIVWANSEGSGETCDKNQFLISRLN